MARRTSSTNRAADAPMNAHGAAQDATGLSFEAMLRIRFAVPSDIDACIDVRGRTRENAVSRSRLAELGITEASWAAQVRADTLPGYVGEMGREIVGYCFGSAVAGEIVVLAVLPEYEGRGLGKRLLGTTMSALRARGHHRLVLGCSDDPRHRSHGFYRHLGWRSTGATDAHGDQLLEHVVAF